MVVNYTFGHYFLLSVISLVIAAFVGFMMWLDYKKEMQKTDKQPEPLVRAVMITAIFYLIMLGAEFFGDYQGLLSKYWWILPMIFVGVMLYYIVIIKFKTPMPLMELLEKHALPLAKEIYGAQKYKGSASWQYLSAWKTTEAGKGEFHDIICVMLLKLKRQGTLFDLLLVHNQRTGANVQGIDNPDVETVEALMGREAVSKLKSWQEQMGDEDIETEKEYGGRE